MKKEFFKATEDRDGKSVEVVLITVSTDFIDGRYLNVVTREVQDKDKVGPEWKAFNTPQKAISKAKAKKKSKKSS